MKILDFEKPIYEIDKKIQELKKMLGEDSQLEEEISNLERRARELKEKIYKNLNRWQKVQLARHPDRPHAVDYIKGMVQDFIELHGDRNFRDDPSIITGLGFIDDYKVAIIAEEKGRDTKEKIWRNFGMPHPEGYRKAMRIMRLADKFRIPVITLVDTPGAFPGIGAEERGQAQAIAESIKLMLKLRVPVITAIIGEGGSGGALAIAVANVVLALRYSIYSVISPEGCASILWRDSTRAPEAAEALKLTAEDLFEFGIVDEIVEEPPGGAHWDPHVAVENLKVALLKHLKSLLRLSPEKLKKHRMEKFRSFGVFADK